MSVQGGITYADILAVVRAMSVGIVEAVLEEKKKKRDQSKSEKRGNSRLLVELAKSSPLLKNFGGRAGL